MCVLVFIIVHVLYTYVLACILYDVYIPLSFSIGLYGSGACDLIGSGHTSALSTSFYTGFRPSQYVVYLN